MIRYLNIFVYLLACAAMLSQLILTILLIVRRTKDYGREVYNASTLQIRSCKAGSVIFVLLSWFLSSGRPYQECSALFAELSMVCSRVGSGWLGFAMLYLIFGLVIGFIRGSASAIEKIVRFRNAAFVQSALFLLLAFLLDVN